MGITSNIFRSLPIFKGKARLAELFLKSSLNKKEPVSFTGISNLHFTIPNTLEVVGKELYINGVYEKRTLEIIKNSLKSSSVFFDVGANIGSISLPIAKTAGAQIHAFEPSKLSFSFLGKNVQDNHLTNITLNNLAVHSEDDLEMQFYEAEEKYGNSSLSATYSQQPHYLVKTISLDAYCKRKDISKIDVLKIDVQGYEIEVLKGAENLLNAKAINTIIFEMESWAEKQAGYPVGASQQFLLDHGYELFSMQSKKQEKVETEGSHMFVARPAHH